MKITGVRVHVLRSRLQPPEIAAAAIQHALAPLAIGADPLEPEVLWHRMYHHTRDYGQGERPTCRPREGGDSTFLESPDRSRLQRADLRVLQA